MSGKMEIKGQEGLAWVPWKAQETNPEFWPRNPTVDPQLYIFPGLCIAAPSGQERYRATGIAGRDP